MSEDPSRRDDYAEAATRGITTVAKNLPEALEELKANKVIRDAIGEFTFEKFIAAKTQECDEFRLNVSQWELDKYLEIY